MRQNWAAETQKLIFDVNSCCDFSVKSYILSLFFFNQVLNLKVICKNEMSVTPIQKI